ncbi:YdcF family protein [Companilactobacillus baiquanensis]|uniref:YdcF family protein n=1 Tax=Companilactobacillus baiquanensis TaxID=2486005 RepID=A0ABW1UV41_9LACO|nr:YdcF family protein [Companilactobacillus baiquanensis]
MFYFLGTVGIFVIEFFLINHARAIFSRFPTIYIILDGAFLIALGWMIFFSGNKVFSSFVAMIFGINLVFFILMINYLIKVWLFKDSAIKDVDYIVVLGTRIMSYRIPPNLKGRLDKTIETYRILKCRPKIIVSGGYSSSNPQSEAKMMRDYLIQNGIEPEIILTEDRSLNTMQNLEFSSVKIQADWQNSYFPQIMIITSEYHVPRVNRYSKDLCLRPNFVQAKTLDLFKYPAMFREFTAILWYHRYTLMTTFIMMFVILVSTLVS